MEDKTREAIERFEKDASNLLPILHIVQGIEKYLSSEAITEISHFLGISKNYTYSVASFYPRFRFSPPGDHVVKVCLCNTCYIAGGESILESVESELDINPGQTTPDGKFSLEKDACLNCSTSAPVLVIDEDIYSGMTPEKVKEVLAQYK